MQTDHESKMIIIDVMISMVIIIDYIVCRAMTTVIIMIVISRIMFDMLFMAMIRVATISSAVLMV